MKRIEAIIHPDTVSAVCFALDSAGLQGATVSQISGLGTTQGWIRQVRGMTYRENQLDKASIEIVTQDKDSDRAVRAILEAVDTGRAGDEVIFIHELVDAIRIRTNESGAEAI